MAEGTWSSANKARTPSPVGYLARLSKIAYQIMCKAIRDTRKLITILLADQTISEKLIN